MTKGRELEAHALSLHIYSILGKKEADGSNHSEVVADLKAFLTSHHLDGHLTTDFKYGQDHGIGLVAQTEFGDTIMLELYSRCEFFPCPDGECQYAPSSFCKWCGKLKG